MAAVMPVRCAERAGHTRRTRPTQYIRYTPSQQGAAYNSGAKQRVIRMVAAQKDPVELPKFKINKKIPRGPPSPPVPVLHSPIRKQAPPAPNSQPSATPPATLAVPPTAMEGLHTINEAKMREQLLKKQKELLEVQKKLKLKLKLELELLQSKASLEEQQKQSERQTGHLHFE